MTTKTTEVVHEVARCTVVGCKCRVRFQGEKIVTVSSRVNSLGQTKFTRIEYATKTLFHVDLFCVVHKRRLIVSAIKAVKNGTKCDARCTSAKGFNCECSCAGANHGADMDLIPC